MLLGHVVDIVRNGGGGVAFVCFVVAGRVGLKFLLCFDQDADVCEGLVGDFFHSCAVFVEELLVDLGGCGEGFDHGVLELLVHVVSKVVWFVQDEVADLLHGVFKFRACLVFDGVYGVIFQDCIS